MIVTLAQHSDVGIIASRVTFTVVLMMTLSLTLNLGNPLSRGSRLKGVTSAGDSQVRIPHISQDTPVFVY